MKKKLIIAAALVVLLVACAYFYFRGQREGREMKRVIDQEEQNR